MTTRLEAFANELEQSNDYRVLRRLTPRGQTSGHHVVGAHEAIILDVETTGLHPQLDEIIELAMVRFAFSENGQVLGAGPTFRQLRQPSISIPPMITALTGIDDAMVAGHTINPDEIDAFMADVDLVIAHNARFDRPFTERLHPSFAALPWACSMAQVDWVGAGAEGRKLSYLLMGAGLFHDGHRGLDDCHAALELLARPLGQTGRTALAHLLDETETTTWRLRAIGAPYAHKNLLRSRCYRWHNGDDGRPRAWFIDLLEEAVDTEVVVLRREIFGSSWQPDLTRITALERFSDRT